MNIETYMDYSRREFLKTSVALGTSLAVVGAPATAVHAAGSDTIRVGLIGCGNRGLGALMDCVQSSPGVEVVALGDLFPDQVEGALARLKDNSRPRDYNSSNSWTLSDRVKVTRDTCFSGFDAYQKVIASGVDLVIVADPAHFRPLHVEAAVQAGKHVFMEKPVAVDPVGVRSIIESSERAKAKGLAMVAGAQRRHDPQYVELMKRIHDGAIGEVVGGQCYWFRGHLWVRERKPGWSDMEWQIRNFVYFTWLCGDCMVETLLHNIDVVNWAFGGPPTSALGVGGRQVRVEPKYGSVYDHFTVEYEYPNGARTTAMCREMPDCQNRVAERIVGTKGVAWCDAGVIQGEKPYKYDGPPVNPYAQEHVDLIQSIRKGEPINEGRRMAESNLTAIMGRMSAYTGVAVNWEFALKHSKLDLTPPSYVLGDMPVPPVAMPGITGLI
ncbi:MAG: Gfo/Idh/MocA family oxidoreductase [Verrucomicrobiota bacterium]